MKKLLILLLTVFCFYGCRSTSEGSDTSSWLSSWWSRTKKDTVIKLAYSSGLMGAYANNLCNKGIYSLHFNGNTYSKMTINSTRTLVISYDNIQPSITQESEVLEENEGTVKFTITVVHGNDKESETYIFNTDTKEFKHELSTNLDNEEGNIKTIPEYCNWVHSVTDKWTKSTKVSTDLTPSKSFTINGKSFSTNYTKVNTTNKSTDPYGLVRTYSMDLEFWLATNGALKDMAIQEITVNQAELSTATHIVNNFSFIKK